MPMQKSSTTPLSHINNSQSETKADDRYEYFVITNDLLKPLSDRFFAAAKAQGHISEELDNAAKTVIEDRQHFAEGIAKILDTLSLYDHTEVVIGTPINSTPSKENLPIQGAQSLPVEIFIQSTKPYQPTKTLSVPQKKRRLPLTAITIENNGFTIEGEYISGMTTGSQSGRLLKLILREDLEGIIPYKLIDETFRVNSDDYKTRGAIIHDLKVILRNNKLKLNMDRKSGINKYTIKSLTKYVRKPRARKKAAKAIKSG